MGAEPMSSFEGRVLLLVDDADLMRRQLEGEDVEFADSLPLRDDISTDEITPARICGYHDERLGDYPYTGLRSGGEFVVEPGAVRRGGFVASVSGHRRGKGSSREASPYAELLAGVRVVVARSFEKIYRQNCHNLGLLTTTDFGVLERIARGEPIPLQEFCAKEDEITAEIIRSGGLMSYTQSRLAGVPPPPRRTSPRPMTLSEKIIAAHVVTTPGSTASDAYVAPGDSCFVRCDLRFSHEYVTPMAADWFHAAFGEHARIEHAESVVLFEDHLTLLDRDSVLESPAGSPLRVLSGLAGLQREFAERHGVLLHSSPRGRGGICHVVVAEDYALPGQVVVGSDSHTCHSGALGCFAIGVGTSDLVASWRTRDVRIRVPATVRIDLSGSLPDGVTAKDLVLALLAQPAIRAGEAVGRVLEYGGFGLSHLPLDERMTITNMAAEMGAFTAIIEPDERMLVELRERRDVPDEIAENIDRLAADADAEYEATIAIDLSRIEPMVALPGDPGNGIPLSALEATRIDIAYGGSCTASKRADLDMYAAVLRRASARGLRVHPEVRFYIQYGSDELGDYCRARGYLDLFTSMGATVLPPGCGACISAGPGASQSPREITISAQNRNFPGRSGPGQVYLASPLTVAASALAGYVTAYAPDESDG